MHVVFMFVKRHQVFIILSFFFFLTRFYNLGILPIFNDESTYIRYGLHNLLEEKGAFYSLLIGKEPLVPYLFAVFGLMFQNLLIGPRIISVLFGFLALLGVYKFCLKFFDRKVAIIASAFYIISPFTLFFDRLALLDSAVSAVAVWTLYLTAQTVRSQKMFPAVALGIVAGIGLWIKTSTSFFVVLPTVYILAESLKKKDKTNAYKSIGIYMGIALFIFSFLYFQPYYKTHAELLKQYTYPPSWFFTFQVHVWVDNLKNSFVWLLFYLPIPIFILSILGMYISFLKKKNLIVFLWFFLPLIYMILFAKLFTSRHVLFLSVPLIIFAAYYCLNIYKLRKIFWGILGICILTSLFYSYFIWFDPQSLFGAFPFHTGGSFTQYAYGYPSGYGVDESIAYIKELRKNGPFYIVVRNDSGNPEDAIVAYFVYNSDFKNHVMALTNPIEQLPLIKNEFDAPVYFISRGAYYAGLEKYFKSEKRFLKPNDKEFIGVYEIDVEKLSP